MLQRIIDSLIGTVKKTFDYTGRAPRFEFWCFTISVWLVNIVLTLVAAVFAAIADILGILAMSIVAFIMIVEFLAAISLAVRRLHDVGLSGFWLLYLSPVGLPVIYIAYLLGLDSSCDKMVEKNLKIGSCWLGWLLTIIAWFLGGASIVLFLIFLYNSQKGTNDYGPNPYGVE